MLGLMIMVQKVRDGNGWPSPKDGVVVLPACLRAHLVFVQ